METTNKSGKEEIPSRTEAFVTFEKRTWMIQNGKRM